MTRNTTNLAHSETGKLIYMASTYEKLILRFRVSPHDIVYRLKDPAISNLS